VQERLQKILARAGFASRRGAEQLMLEGRVTVNAEIVRELGTKADLDCDDVRVDGVRVKAPKGPVYVVLNKPRGYVTTRKDPEGRPTVMDLVPSVPGLFPVGRLDVTTEGLILLTTDGAFAERVSHPRYEVPRVYHAKVHGVPDARALELLRRGVTVERDVMAVDRVRVLEADNNAWVEVTLHEGKQHEVKRMLEAVGHPVSKLRRVAFGPVTTRGLEPGQFRALTPEEVAGLLRGEGRRVPAERPSPRRRRPRRAQGPADHRRPGVGRREDVRTERGERGERPRSERTERPRRDGRSAPPRPGGQRPRRGGSSPPRPRGPGRGGRR
jgi:23S rRNA pseudouridine2605 synthase